MCTISTRTIWILQWGTKSLSGLIEFVHVVRGYPLIVARDRVKVRIVIAFSLRVYQSEYDSGSKQRKDSQIRTVETSMLQDDVRSGANR